MSLEKTIIDLTSKTSSGGTCWIGNLPFTVWFDSDYWEWEFQGAYYFDPLDLSEAIEAFLEETTEGSPLPASLPEKAKASPRLGIRKSSTAVFHRGPTGRLSGLQPKHLHPLNP